MDGGRARSYKFLTELQNIKNNQTEVKNTITEMKSKLERINSILKDTEKWIRGLEGKSSGNY